MKIAIAGTRYVGLSNCDVILANRRIAELDDVIGKLYTRDLFGFD